MTTYHPDFRYQTPIAADVRGIGTVGDPAVDSLVTLTIPNDWDNFWNGTRGDGLDIVLTDHTGRTVVEFRRQTFTPGTRTLELRARWTAPSGQRWNLLWLHWGAPSWATDLHDGALAISPTRLGHLTLERPPSILDYNPRQIVLAGVKDPGDTRFLYFRFPLLTRVSPFSGLLAYEFPSYVTVTAEDSTGTDADTILDHELIRFGSLGVVRVAVTGGSTDELYTVKCAITTTLGRVLQARARLLVSA